MAVGDSGVNGRRADIAMSEVVLDELERGPGVEQVRGDRMAQRVGREVTREASQRAVPNESHLDLPSAQRAMSAGEQRVAGFERRAREVRLQQGGRALEQDLLAPCAALQAPNEHPTTHQVHILTAEQQHLSHSQPVVVHEREQGAVAGMGDTCEETEDLLLREVARRALVGIGQDGQGGERVSARGLATALNSRKAQCAAKARGTGVFASGGAGSPQAFRWLGGGSNAAVIGGFRAAEPGSAQFC